MTPVASNSTPSMTASTSSTACTKANWPRRWASNWALTPTTVTDDAQATGFWRLAAYCSAHSHWAVGRCFKQKDKGPLLLSARDDADGKHYAVGYHLDGNQVFAHSRSASAATTSSTTRHCRLRCSSPVAQAPKVTSIDLRDGAPAANHHLEHQSPLLRPCGDSQERRLAVRHRERYVRSRPWLARRV